MCWPSSINLPFVVRNTFFYKIDPLSSVALVNIIIWQTCWWRDIYTLLLLIMLLFSNIYWWLLRVSCTLLTWNSAEHKYPTWNNMVPMLWRAILLLLPKYHFINTATGAIWPFSIDTIRLIIIQYKLYNALSFIVIICI